MSGSTGERRGVNALVLKLIAMAVMLVDHTALALFNGGWFTGGISSLMIYYVMRGIGRLAFPIFGFQIVEGAIHTKKRWWYLGRLLVLALISEVPFDLTVFGSWIYPQGQNVFFTLALGLLAVYGIQWGTRFKKRKPLGILAAVAIVAACCVAAKLLRTDYSYSGVLMISAMGVLAAPLTPLRRRLTEQSLRMFFFAMGVAMVALFSSTIEALALLDLVLIWFYNGKKGYSNRFIQYGCYFYYPLHLLIVGLIFVATRI